MSKINILDLNLASKHFSSDTEDLFPDDIEKVIYGAGESGSYQYDDGSSISWHDGVYIAFDTEGDLYSIVAFGTGAY